MIEQRVFGTEMEWGLSVVRPGFASPRSKNKQTLREYEVPGDTEISGIVRQYTPTNLDSLPGHPRLKRIGYMLSNGGKFYADHGHPEYCTPEVTTLDDLVACEIVGERIVLQTLQAAVADRRLDGFALNKRVVDEFYSSWGYHENYQVDRRFLDPERYRGSHADAFDLLAAHLATRTIYCGAGAVRRGQFLLGQKASVLTCDYHPDTVNQKPLINLRDEPHGDEVRFARLHIPSADPHMSPWATKMSVGTTAIVISMIECGLLLEDNIRLPHGHIHRIAQQVSQDVTCKQAFRRADGTYTTALEIQEYLLQKAKQWAAGRVLTNDDRMVLEQWEHSCDAIAKDPLSLRDRAEWPYKLHWLTNLIAKRKAQCPGGDTLHWRSPEVAERELQWDRIGTAGSIGALLRTKAWAAWMPPDTLIQERMLCPPATRAMLRKKFIESFADHGRGYADWAKCVSLSGTVILPDPRTPVDRQLDAILQNNGS